LRKYNYWQQKTSCILRAGESSSLGGKKMQVILSYTRWLPLIYCTSNSARPLQVTNVNLITKHNEKKSCLLWFKQRNLYYGEEFPYKASTYLCCHVEHSAPSFILWWTKLALLLYLYSSPSLFTP
jgi:hypothetical protein